MKRTPLVYIAGPYRADKERAPARFREASRRLWELGYVTHDPIACTGHLDGLYDNDEYVVRDLSVVERCDAIYLLDGWEDSDGARAEARTATDHGLTVFLECGIVPFAADFPGLVVTAEADTETSPQRDPLPSDAAERKAYPLYRGLMVYFPHALAAVANLSYRGNEQHHPGTPLHWDRNKSTDEEDALLRHMLDGDWTAVAWRALAKLQKVMEAS